MDWKSIGMRIRKQRELLGYTRETFSERLGVTPKFCADIELGQKGISVPTLCKLSEILMLSSDYILFGNPNINSNAHIHALVDACPAEKQIFLEDILKAFVLAVDTDTPS